MNNNVDKKIELWKEINSYINNIEEKYSQFFSIFAAIFGVMITVLSSDWIKNESLSLRIIGLLFITITVFLTISYFAYNFRFVAVARMYAAKLEEKINEDLGENIYVWNSDIIDKYMSKRNIINTKVLPIVNSILFIFVLVSLNYSMWNLNLSIWISIPYTIITIVLFGFCIASFAMNEKIRKDDYKL